jgi:hypothetical protein
LAKFKTRFEDTSRHVEGYIKEQTIRGVEEEMKKSCIEKKDDEPAPNPSSAPSVSGSEEEEEQQQNGDGI